MSKFNRWCKTHKQNTFYKWIYGPKCSDSALDGACFPVHTMNSFFRSAKKWTREKQQNQGGKTNILLIFNLHGTPEWFQKIYNEIKHFTRGCDPGNTLVLSQESKDSCTHIVSINDCLFSIDLCFLTASVVMCRRMCMGNGERHLAHNHCTIDPLFPCKKCFLQKRLS